MWRNGDRPTLVGEDLVVGGEDRVTYLFALDEPVGVAPNIASDWGASFEASGWSADDHWFSIEVDCGELPMGIFDVELRVVDRAGNGGEIMLGRLVRQPL